ncbi:kinase-like domain-containing protein [Xylaria sp. FL1042]|nr:kinase-like domain-containing protein [Xylaria sp. FL1042]
MAAARHEDVVEHDETDTQSHSDDNDDPYDLLQFGPETLCTWATSARNELIRSDETNRQNTAPIECIKALVPISGSYNTVFPLQFSDGVCWALKVPQAAAQDGFDASAARSLTSEARTMLVLEKQTTIPVPKVHSVQPGPDNNLGSPYILTDFINGTPLPKVWFDHSAPEDVLESRRMQSLQDLAQAMIQLGQFTFSRSGCPEFDSQGIISGVGPLRTLDIAASLIVQRAEGGTDIMCDLGPFKDATSYILSLFNRRNPPPDPFSTGIYKLLQLFVEWLSELKDYEDGGFVLSHPDLDMQNILVTENGRICGIIDWEGVAVVPKCLGNLCYPSFLTRDWDPMIYNYDPSGTAEDNELENSPEELQRFRAAYCDMIGKLLGSRENESPKWTRRSLVIENLKIAADNPASTHGIIEKVFEEIKRNSPRALVIDGEDLHLYDIACDVAAGSINEGTLEVIKDGFLHLCNSV